MRQTQLFQLGYLDVTKAPYFADPSGPQPLVHLVWREHLTTRYRTLEVDETDAMEGVARGDSFAALCERLTRRHADEAVPLRAVSFLKRWLTEGLISEIL